jgi:hypothetical protein
MSGMVVMMLMILKSVVEDIGLRLCHRLVLLLPALNVLKPFYSSLMVEPNKLERLTLESFIKLV